MDKKHNFVRLAEVQREQGTLYNGGLDIHPFGSYDACMEVYGSAVPSRRKTYEYEYYMTVYDAYKTLAGLCPMKSGKIRDQYIKMLAAVEMYTREVVRILIEKAEIFSFKPQSSFYEQFGFPGLYLLMQIRYYIRDLADQNGVDAICMLDCKRGDIFTTQAAYFRGLLGNLMDGWGIDFSPYDLDIINVTPYMGKDTMVLLDKGKPALGLKLMREGKGIIGVNKTSNPSGPDYQELYAPEVGSTIQMKHVRDCNGWSQEFELEHDGLSTIGLVVGSTHQCDGSIRAAFPSTTMLVPGFGAQEGDFPFIMPELIRGDHPWNGQGAIFSASRSTMFAWMEKYGGSGQVSNLEDDLLKGVANFRKNEKKAFEAPKVVRAGIEYPF